MPQCPRARLPLGLERPAGADDSEAAELLL